MADNVAITPGTGDTVAADDIGTVKYQRVKITPGADVISEGDVSSTNPLPIGPATLTMRVDDTTTASTVYVGKAVIGTAASAASWRIYKYDSATIAAIKYWADGDAAFDNIWDNRASLTYS